MIGAFATVYKIVAALRYKMFIYLPFLRQCVIMDGISYETRTLNGHRLCEALEAIMATVRIFGVRYHPYRTPVKIAACPSVIIREPLCRALSNLLLRNFCEKLSIQFFVEI
jgi:hypothetical protein